MFDGPRPIPIYESGKYAGHADKFHWTIDVEKYPNHPITVIGLNYRKGHPLSVLFGFAEGSRIAVYDYDTQNVEKIVAVDLSLNFKAGFFFYSSFQALKVYGKNIIFRSIKFDPTLNLKDFYGPYHFPIKPVVINGLENLNIKFKE